MENSLGKRISRRLSSVRADFSLSIIEAGLITVAYAAALGLRSLEPSDPISNLWWTRLGYALPVIIVVHLGANLIFGNYGHVWRYASIEEALRVVAAGMSAGIVIIALAGFYQWIIHPAAPVPLSVLVLGTILSLAGMGAIRFWSRMFSKQRIDLLQLSRERALVVGTGADAVNVARHRSEAVHGIGVVGFIDVACDGDRSRVLAGYPILGGLDDVPRLVTEQEIDQIIIACPEADTYGRKLVDLCMDVEVRLRILPNMDSILEGNKAARDIRDLELIDLLPRTQVATDLTDVGRFLNGRCVLVTGAGGSIGSEIVAQALAFGASRVVALDHDETHLHDSSVDWLAVAASGPDALVFELADIRDSVRLAAIFDEHQPEVVFHAAAHKHVPILEACPDEAVKTNIAGTVNVVDEAERCAATEAFVLISTDKAVNPHSVMGASKRMAEMIVQTRANSLPEMKWCSVRFGNVLGSRGSVVPTFKQQVQHGGPVTVSHEDMERYFMTVGEAVELVMQAASMSTGGEVFVLDMGEPVRILDLAHRMIRLAGLVPYKDIDVVITGLRPGERLSEQLAISPLVPSAHPKILVARESVPTEAHLNETLAYLRRLTDQGEGRLGDMIVAVANDVLISTNLESLRPEVASFPLAGNS
ncbi:MAG TPA: nucleoside-diphosphate sugar epimerase/dehydratase [Acidimicrobiia bacterium]